jgi:hypothetical protein
LTFYQASRLYYLKRFEGIRGSLVPFSARGASLERGGRHPRASDASGLQGGDAGGQPAGALSRPLACWGLEPRARGATLDCMCRHSSTGECPGISVSDAGQRWPAFSAIIVLIWEFERFANSSAYSAVAFRLRLFCGRLGGTCLGGNRLRVVFRGGWRCGRSFGDGCGRGLSARGCCVYGWRPYFRWGRDLRRGRRFGLGSTKNGSRLTSIAQIRIV